jgi:hypothetical protein
VLSLKALPPNRGSGDDRQPRNDLDPEGNLPDRTGAKADSRRAFLPAQRRCTGPSLWPWMPPGIEEASSVNPRTV